MEAEQKRTDYFDYLRIIASFAVVMIHVSVYVWKSADVTTWAWSAANFYDSLARFAVPIFVMISGALFLGGRQSIAQIYKKSILRIVIAFLFWSAIYALVSFMKGAPPKDTVIQWVEGHYHLWFLPMIVGLYMITPFLRKIVESRSLTKYFLITSLILGVILPQIVELIPLFSKELGKAVNSVWSDLHLTVGYASYFVFGYVLQNAELSRKAERIIYLLGICGLLATFLLTAAVSVWKGAPKDLFYENFTVNVFLYSVAIFVFAGRHFPKITGMGCRLLLRKLSKYSFGVYLVHALVLEQSYEVLGGYLNPWLEIPLFTAAVFVVAMLISGLFHLIPGLRRYVV